MMVLILFSVFVVLKFLDFRYDIVPSTSKSSTPLFFALYYISKISLFYRSALGMVLGLLTVGLDIVLNFGEVGCGMVAAFLVVRRYVYECV